MWPDRTAELSSIVGTLHQEVARRSAAENALRRSEERSRAIVEQATEIIFTLDRDGAITSLNPAFEATLGWKAEEWIGRPFVSLAAPDARLHVESLIERAKSEGSLPLSQCAALARDGRLVVIESTLAPKVINGEVAGFFGVGRDVTERENQQTTLRRSERQLAESQRIAKLGSWEHDLRTQRIWWSDEHYRIFGLEPGTPITFERFLSMIDEEARQKVLEHRAYLDETGPETASNGWELSITLPDGQRRDVVCRARRERADGKVVRLVGITMDVTEQKKAEQRLRESEERFRLVARATNDAVWDWNAATNSLWWSSAYGQLFGYSPEEYTNNLEACLDRLHPDDRERVRAGLFQAIDSGMDTWADEYRYRRADGSYATVLDRGLLIRDATKTVVRVTGAMADVTERRKLEEQLAHSRRVNSLGRIAASIAHEFNNVLMGMQTNLEVIAKRSSADLAVPAGHIMHSVQRGKRVVDEILRFTRPPEPVLACVEVSSFLERWASEIGPVLGSTIALELDTAPDLYMLADAAQIAQVLTNVAVNARDAMSGGGRLSVHADQGKSFISLGVGVKTPDAFVHIRVTDTGAGIPPEQMASIFEPLFTTKKDGTGLGLAISYQLINRHNGYLHVESEVGAGSTFHLLIPTTHPMLAEHEPAAVPSSTLPMNRILLVEDDAAVASGMKLLLESEGVIVETVGTGGETMAAIGRFSPDAVVLDIGLPDCDGTDVFREIEERWPDLPVLFSSGHVDAAKMHDYLSRGRVGLLRKPYDFRTLCEALATLIQE